MNFFNPGFTLQEKRWLWLDYDKGISILLVGYGHSLATLVGHVPNLGSYTFFNYIGAFMYGFRMPLFFIISGMLISRSLRKKGTRNYIFDRVNTILYPLLIWGFIEISLQIIAGHYTKLTTGEIVGYAKYLQLLIEPRATGHFWYLNALFCIGVIYALLKTGLTFNPFIQITFGLLLYGIYAYISLNNADAGFLTDVCKYYIFFALGDLASDTLLDEKNKRILSSWTLFVPLMTAFIFIQYYFTKINLQHNDYGYRFAEVKMPFSFLAESLIGCAASMNLSFLLQRYKVFGWLRFIGYYSLYIYLLQVIIMAFARVFFQNVLHINNVPALIILIWLTGTFIPIFFYNLCMRYNIWRLYTFKRPKEAVVPSLA